MPTQLMPWGALRVVYLLAIFGLGLGAAIVLAAHPAKTNWVSFSVLLLMACATIPLNIKLPGVDRTISLSFLFTFSAIVLLPANAALCIGLVAFVFKFWADEHEESPWYEISFNIGSLATCIFGAAYVYEYLMDVQGWQWPQAAWLSAATYYLITSSTNALRIAIEEQSNPWKVWRLRFFWTGPIYMLAPVGLGAVKWILDAKTNSEALMGLAFTFAGFLYVKSYFARLHDQQDHDRELAEIRHRGIETLAAAIEAKDGSTAGHLRRVKLHATRLAKALGCKDEEIPTLQMAAVLHDVGKVGVPDYILMKPGRLTDHEFKEIANHTRVGAEILKSARFPGPVEEIVLCHHEHWDGSGYPNGLTGEQIPRLARILTVVDCFDALITDRPYRPALSIDQAVAVMREQRGRIFDPKILDMFLDEFPSFLKELKQDLEQDREQATTFGRPALEISQTWISDGAEHEAALRHKSLRALAHAPAKLVAFYEILDLLGVDLNLEKNLNQCLSILRKAVPFDKAGIFVFEKGKYVLLAAEGIPDHCVNRLTVSTEHGLAAHAAIARTPVVADTVPFEIPGERPPLYFDDVGSTLAAPLIVNERVIGMMVLCGAGPGAFHEDQALSLNLITGKLARTLISSQAVQKVYLEAETDTVTGLPNARAAFRKLKDELKRADREGRTVGVLFMDIDDLKPVNDSYGHGAGDQLLVETANKLKDRLRTYDFACRIGGDEFLAILPGVSAEGLPGTVESLKQAVANNAVRVAQGVYVQAAISIGATLFPEDGRDPEELVYLADQRMYEDKEREKRRPRRGSRRPPASEVHQAESISSS